MNITSLDIVKIEESFENNPDARSIKIGRYHLPPTTVTFFWKIVSFLTSKLCYEGHEYSKILYYGHLYVFFNSENSR